MTRRAQNINKSGLTWTQISLTRVLLLRYLKTYPPHYIKVFCEKRIFLKNVWLGKFESRLSWALSTSTTHSWGRVSRCHYDSIRDMRCGSGDNHPIIGQIWLLTPTPVILMIHSHPPPSSIIISLISMQYAIHWSMVFLTFLVLEATWSLHWDILGLISLIGWRLVKFVHLLQGEDIWS